MSKNKRRAKEQAQALAAILNMSPNDAASSSASKAKNTSKETAQLATADTFNRVLSNAQSGTLGEAFLLTTKKQAKSTSAPKQVSSKQSAKANFDKSASAALGEKAEHPAVESEKSAESTVTEASVGVGADAGAGAGNTSNVSGKTDTKVDVGSLEALTAPTPVVPQVYAYADMCKFLRANHLQALLLLQLTDLFLKCAVSDPMDGQGLYVDQDTFLAKLYQQLSLDEQSTSGEQPISDEPGKAKTGSAQTKKAQDSADDSSQAKKICADQCLDRLSWMWTFIQDAARSIMYQPHTTLLREHKNIPLQFVREVDTSTMIWLARRSGRNIREKLQGRNTILAVSRHMEINTLENRLFKEVITKFQELFELKRKALRFEDPAFHELSSRVWAWLHSDDAQDIKPWDNLEPNNLLLADRQYHKIWMAYNWLKELDQEIQFDYAEVDTRFLQTLFWALAASLHARPEVACLALPCEFDMQRLETKTYCPLWYQAPKKEPLKLASLSKSDNSASAQKSKSTPETQSGKGVQASSTTKSGASTAAITSNSTSSSTSANAQQPASKSNLAQSKSTSNPGTAKSGSFATSGSSADSAQVSTTESQSKQSSFERKMSRLFKLMQGNQTTTKDKEEEKLQAKTKADVPASSSADSATESFAELLAASDLDSSLLIQKQNLEKSKSRPGSPQAQSVPESKSKAQNSSAKSGAKIVSTAKVSKKAQPSQDKSKQSEVQKAKSKQATVTSSAPATTISSDSAAASLSRNLKQSSLGNFTSSSLAPTKPKTRKLKLNPHKLYRFDGRLNLTQPNSSFVLTLDPSSQIMGLDCANLNFLLLAKVQGHQLISVKLPRSLYALWSKQVEQNLDPIEYLHEELSSPNQSSEWSLVQIQSLELSWSGLKAAIGQWLQNLGLALPTTPKSSTPTVGATLPVSSTHGAAILDLSTWQPRFKADDDPITYTPYKLLMQLMRHPSFDKMMLDVGLTRGLLLSPKVQICSTTDIFFHEQHRVLNDSDLSSVLYQFLTKLKDNLKCQQLYYLIPDGLHEFSLRTLYRQITHFYKNAMPLPRSIAAVLSYQLHNPKVFASLKEFVVLVVSLLGEQYVFTPVKGTYNKELHQLLPESHGWSWERYPSQVVASAKLKQIVPEIFAQYPKQAAAIRLVPADLCALQDSLTFFMPQEKVTLDNLNATVGGFSVAIGSEGESGRLDTSATATTTASQRMSAAQGTLVTQVNSGSLASDFWQYLTLDQTTVAKTKQKLASVDLDSGVALELLNKKWFEDLPVYCLHADCQLGELRLNRLNSRFSNLGKIESLDANIVLHKYEQLLLKFKLEDTDPPALWKDHLPELFLRASQNGTLCYVPLVKNTTIMPRFGEAIELNSCNFILPANQSKFYHFPLTQSEGGEKLRYEVRIRSDVFPLTEEVPCELRMSYTYGAEQPYRLRVLAFNPEKAPFTELETEWIDSNDIQRPSPVPQLPVKQVASLDELTQASSGKVSDIKLILQFLKLCESYRDFRRGSDLVKIENGQYLNYAAYIKSYTQDFSEYLTTEDVDLIWVYPDDRNKVQAALRHNKGITVIVKENNRNEADFTLLGFFDIVGKRSFDALMNKAGAWRYCAHKIWENGRSLFDMLEQPENLAELSSSQQEELLELQDYINGSLTWVINYFVSEPNLQFDKLVSNLMTILACMGKDAPDAYWNYLLKQQDPKWWHDFMNMIRLGLVIGRRETEDQQQMWSDLCKFAQNPDTLDLALTGMSVNYSNNIEYLVQNMQRDEIEMLIDLVLTAIEHFVEHPNKDEKRAGMIYSKIAEIIFILLLTRQSKDPKIASLMDSNNPESLKMVDAIEQIIEDCEKRHLTIKTFVKFALNKPASRKAVPDLLYAVHMYLTGDDGTADIKITSIDAMMADNY